MGSWDDLDTWAAEQRKKLPPTAGPGECAETGATISADRARTIQAAARIARGFHPFGLRLREPAGEKCGSCRHLQRSYTSPGRWFNKCALRGVTRGPATDLRLKWPACERWEGQP